MLVVRLLSVLCECCKCLAELGLNCSHVQQQICVVHFKHSAQYHDITDRDKVFPLQAQCGPEGG